MPDLTTTPIPTASVIAILKTPEIDRLVLTRATVSTVLKAARDNELVVFDSASNNILNFEHSVFADAGASIGKKLSVKVDVVDPNNSFESSLLFVGFKALYGSNQRAFEEINRLKALKTPSDSADLINLKKKKEQLENIIVNFQAQLIEDIRRTNISNKLKNAKGEKDQLEDQIKELAIQQDKEFYDKVQNELNKLNAECTPGIYFFYGVGKEEDSWAGPVYGVLNNVEYKYNGEGGIRILSLEYVGSDAIMTSVTEKVFYNGLGRTLSVDVQDTGSFHNTITTCLKAFLAHSNNLPIDNVVILLPNLDTALDSLYRKFIIAGGNVLSQSSAKAALIPLSRQQTYNTVGFDIDRVFLSNPLFTNQNRLGNPNLEGFSYSSPLELDFNIAINLTDKETIQEKLSEVKNGIINNSSFAFNSFELTYETDNAVKALYEQYAPLSGTYNSEMPLLIYGDYDFIAKFFYGFTEADLSDDKVKAQNLISPFDYWLVDGNRLNNLHSYFRNTGSKPGVFDNLFYKLPDEFAYSEGIVTSKKNTVSITETSIPIFIHGYENSNILSINLDWKMQYYKEIAGAFRPNFKDTVTVNSVPGESFLNLYSTIKNYSAKNMNEDGLDKFLSKLDTFVATGSKARDIRSIKSLFLSDLPGMTDELAEDLAISFVTLYLNSGGTGRKLSFNEFVENGLATKMYMLMENISNSALFAQIKTFPLFKFFRTFHALRFPALLLMREAAVVGQEKSSQIINQMISGDWQIVGFKHIISEGEIGSYFNLMRVPSSSAKSALSIIKKPEVDITQL